MKRGSVLSHRILYTGVEQPNQRRGKIRSMQALAGGLLLSLFLGGCGAVSPAETGDGETLITEEATIETTGEIEATATPSPEPTPSASNLPEVGENTVRQGWYTFWIEDWEREPSYLLWNMETGEYVFWDGEKEISYELETDVEPLTIDKLDLDGDGVTEYVITACSGRGTEVYSTDLFYIREDSKTAIAYLSGQEIVSILQERLSCEYDEEWEMITVYEKGEEKASLALRAYLEKKGEEFGSFTIGNILHIENRQGEFWINAPFGLTWKDSAQPWYDYTVDVAAPILYEDGAFVLGELTCKAGEFSQGEESEVREDVELAVLLADTNHDGEKERLILSYPAVSTWDEVQKGQAEAHLTIYPSGEGRYANASNLEWSFGGHKMLSNQMILTTVDGRDYLIQTSFQEGLDQYTNTYKVFFCDTAYDYVVDSAEGTFVAGEDSATDFFEGLNAWINDSSILLYAADTSYEPVLQYSTKEKVIHPREYLKGKEAQTK